MGRWPGGRRLAEGIEKLRTALLDYYGALNEYKTLVESQPNLASTINIPDKPEALTLWEKCQWLGLPLTQGGLLQQPHIWLEEIAVVREIEMMFKALQK